MWRMPLTLEGARADRVVACLSPEERRRRRAFFDGHRGRSWALARGALRMLLAAYTGEPPDEFQLAFSCYGKPMLRSYALRFSVSHTDELALYAVTREGSVGIDVERVAPERASVLVPVRSSRPRRLRTCGAALPNSERASSSGCGRDARRF